MLFADINSPVFRLDKTRYIPQLYSTFPEVEIYVIYKSNKLYVNKINKKKLIL